MSNVWRSRAAAKANITKKIKELTEWKMTCDNLIDARAKVKEFSDVVASFYTAHSNYHDAIDDEYDVIDSEEYARRLDDKSGNQIIPQRIRGEIS